MPLTTTFLSVRMSIPKSHLQLHSPSVRSAEAGLDPVPGLLRRGLLPALQTQLLRIQTQGTVL